MNTLNIGCTDDERRVVIVTDSEPMSQLATMCIAR